MTRSFKVFWEFYWRLLYNLRAEYWVVNCGLDAYLYLLFQRKFLKLMLLFCFVAVTIPLPLNIYAADGTLKFFESTILSNERFDGIKSWVNVMIVVLFTLATLVTIFDLKEIA